MSKIISVIIAICIGAMGLIGYMEKEKRVDNTKFGSDGWHNVRINKANK